MLNNTEYASQRWLLARYKKEEALASQFLAMDHFLRGIPKLQLETNEYIVTQLEAENFLVRRFIGFQDSLPDNFCQKDLLVRTLTEKSASLSDFTEFLDGATSQKNKNLTLYILNGFSNDPGFLEVTVRERIIECL